MKKERKYLNRYEAALVMISFFVTTSIGAAFFYWALWAFGQDLIRGLFLMVAGLAEMLTGTLGVISLCDGILAGRIDR